MMSSDRQRLLIEELAPRDGFRIESRSVPTEHALDCRVCEFNLVMCASEPHNASNLRMHCEQSLTQFARSAKLNQADILNKKAHTPKGCGGRSVPRPRHGARNRRPGFGKCTARSGTVAA
jgi:hypothetical protein